MIVVSGGAGGLVDPTLLRVTDLSRTLGDNLSMRVRKKLRQDYFYPLGDATSVKTKKPKTVKLWNVPCVHTLPTGARRQAVVKAEVTASTGTDVSGDSNSCVSDTISSEYQYINPTNSVTMEKDLLDSAPVSDVGTVSNPTTTTGGGFRACDLSFGNACFATGTLGLIIASVAVSAVATNVYQIPRRKLLIRTNAPKSVIESVNLTILCSNTTAKMDNYDNISNTNEEDCTCGQPYANTSFNSSSLCVPVTQFPTESDKQPTQISTSDQSKVSTDQGIPPPVTSASNANSILENSTSIVAGAVLTSEAFNQLFPVSTSPIIDAHCHLQLGPLWEDSVSAVTLAQRVGIKHLIVCGTAPGDDWLRVQELSRRFPGSVRANYGVHPWRIASLITSGSDKGADTTIVSSTSSSSILSTTSILTQSWLPSVMESLESLLLADPLAGVGECGLDKSIKKEASLELQNEILHAHFQLARKHHRSITLHCVGAWGRLYDVVLENSRASEPIVASMVDNSIGTHILVDNNVVSVSTNNYNYSNSNDRVKSVILHCCNSMPIEFVSLFAALPDVYFSLTMKTFCEKEAALCRAIPLTRLLLETDSPDQLPIEFRRLRVSSVPSTLETSAPPYTTTTSGINTDATDINDNNMSTSQPIFDYNQPALLHYGAQKVARILNLELDQIASITYENTLRAFF